MSCAVAWQTPTLLSAVLGVTACAPSAPKAAKTMDVIRQESTPDRLLARGDSAASVGDLTRAEQYFVAAMSAGGDERALTKRLLIVCSADSRFPAAAKYGEDFLRRHPGDTEVRFAVATVYIALGEAARARVELEQVIKERPDIADAHYALADVLRHDGTALLEADGQYREYLRLSPTGPNAEAARSLLLKSVP